MKRVQRPFSEDIAVYTPEDDLFLRTNVQFVGKLLLHTVSNSYRLHQNQLLITNISSMY